MEKRTCGDCEHYLYYTVTGPAEGWCKVLPGAKEGEPGKVVRFDTDATSCPEFEKVTSVVTDGSQFEYDPHLRIYGEHEEKKSDVRVQTDERYWG